MAVVSPHISIIALNVNDLNSPMKGTEWLGGLKNKAQLHVVFRRLIPALRQTQPQSERVEYNTPSEY